jgi:hypothetical protein
VCVVDRVKQSPGLVGLVKKDVERAVTIPERGRIRIVAGRELGILEGCLHTHDASMVADGNGTLSASLPSIAAEV